MSEATPIYGLMAEFDTPESLVSAAQHAREEGYQKLDAYSPMPVEGLSDAIGFHASRFPFLVFIGGICGCVGGYLLQYYTQAISFPTNVGGRPFNSWPAFIPVTFEMTILAAAITAVVGMLALNGLPMPYHPVFNAPHFKMASRDRFFLCIEAQDQKFDREGTKHFLESLHSLEVVEVEP